MKRKEKICVLELMTFNGKHHARYERSQVCSRSWASAGLTPTEERTWGWEGKAQPKRKLAAGGAGTLALTPVPGGQGVLSRGHPLTGQGTVTFNWLMTGEHFEDEKYQVGIITIQFLR